MPAPARSRLRAVLEEAFLDERSALYHRVQGVVTVLIVGSVAAMVLESVPALAQRHQHWFDLVEVVVVVAFTLEYLINIFVAPDRRRYVLGPWGIIDLLAVLPSLLLMLDIQSPTMAGVLRTLRVLRILRVLKLAKLMAQKFHQREGKANTFWMDLQIYFIALFCALTILSTLAYHAERNQPDTRFTSIPEAMWWGIVTLTTTGYGDMIPVTPWGRLVAAGSMVMGLALFGLLMNVVGKVMLASLFGHAEHEPAPPAARGAGGPACACGEPLQLGWRLCPLCGAAVPPARSA